MEMFEPTGWLPDAQVVKALLTEEECRVIIQAAEEKLYVAERITDEGGLVVDTAYRDCRTSHFEPGSEVYRIISERVVARLAELNEHYGFDLFDDVSSLIPVINVNRYDSPGGRIGPHTDVGGYVGCDDRKLSLTILLNTDFEGGSFYLNSGKPTVPFNQTPNGRGDAAVFPSFVMHAVSSVTAGQRYSAVVWLRGPKFK